MSTIPFLEPPAELLSQMPAALTILDQQGRLLYYSPYAPKILDRRPEYLGRDVRELHQPASAAKITAILEAYARGERREYTWTLERDGRLYGVRVAPWIRQDQWAGVLHVAMLVS